MLQRCFSIFDTKTNYYQPPFFSPTTASGVRLFQNLVNDETSMASKFPADFRLMLIGAFDDTTGAFQAQSPEMLCTAQQLKEPVPEPVN